MKAASRACCSRMSPEVRMVWMRRAEVEILDTWHTGGLRGTGSHDVVVKDRLVPRRLHLSPLDGSTLAGTLGRVPIVCNMAAGYAAQLVRAGGSRDRRAGEAHHQQTGGRPWAGARRASRGAGGHRRTPHAHRRGAPSLAGLRRAAVGRCGSRTASRLGPSPRSSAPRITGWRRDAPRSTPCTPLAGASALYTSSPLERIHRDMHAMAAHVIAQPLWLEDTGRVLLGAQSREPFVPGLIANVAYAAYSTTVHRALRRAHAVRSTAQAPAGDEPLEEVVVTGEFPGPGHVESDPCR